MNAMLNIVILKSVKQIELKISQDEEPELTP